MSSKPEITELRPRMPLYLILMEAGENYDQKDRYLKAHLAYLHQLDAQGFLIGAGPCLTIDHTTYTGGGLMVVRGEDLGEAHEIASADPFMLHKVRDYRIIPWLLSEGVLFDHLRYSVEGS